MISSLSNEEWRPIEGFPLCYVSNFGRIISKRRYRDGMLVKQQFTKNGYCSAQLYDDKNVCRRVLVHRMVAFSFVDNPDSDVNKEVNHIDGNKQNNTPDNLEWCDRKKNMRHAVKTGLMKNVGVNWKHEDKFKILQTEIDGTPVRSYLNAHEAELIFGGNFSAIRAAVRKGSLYYGFLWRRCSNDEYNLFCDCIVVKRCDNKRGPNLPVLQLSNDGSVLCEYPSQKIAAESVGVTRRSIGGAIKSGGLCAGYHWSVKGKQGPTHNSNEGDKVGYRLLMDEDNHIVRRKSGSRIPLF